MRNLKRALSLVLAALMLMGMMVVGAGAAGTYDEFTDKDEIVNKDAVSMLTILGVVNGKEDGSFFDPTGDVTRAEMAKMIATILNQGADVNDLYANMNTGLKDIDNSWAKGYINYCYSLGIIAGRGDGRFDPTAPVTGNEAAKMLLVAIGYDPAVEGLTGSAWAIKTTALASTLGIFDDLTAPTNEKLSRDNAALVIYNALDVELIQKYEDGYAITFEDHRTLLSTKYGVYKVEGTVVANEWAELNKTNSDAAQREGKTILDNVVLYSSTTSNTTVNEGVAQAGQIPFNVTTPVDYLGKAVTMYIKKTTILSDSKVIGVTLKDSVNVVTGSAATSKDAATFLKGTGLKVNSDTEYYVNYGYYSAANATKMINDYEVMATGDIGNKFNLNGVEIEVIDNNNDGNADYVLYLQETLSQVIRYNKSAETVSFYQPKRNAANELISGTNTVVRDFEDVVFNGEVDTESLILYVEYGGRTYISLPEIVTGTMTRVDRDKSNELYITLSDGKEYRQSYILDTASTVDVELDHFVIDTCNKELGFTAEYDFVLDSNGYVVAVRPTEKVEANYALVLGSAWTQNALKKEGQVKILKADGIVETYAINWDKSDDAFVGLNIPGTTAEAKLEAYLGTRDVVVDDETPLNSAMGSVITYSLDSDNVLTIESVLQGNTMKDSTSLAISKGQNTSTTAGVGDNGHVIFMGQTKSTLQTEVHTKYTNGTGSLTIKGVDETNTGKYDTAYGVNFVADDGTKSTANRVNRTSGTVQTDTYAIDLNTVAFYFEDKDHDGVADSDEYGVVTGWDDMQDVDVNVGVQVYPVLTKTNNKTYQATKLAGVVLFEVAPTTESNDYMLVLAANAATKDSWELQVAFEDSTSVQKITVLDKNLGDFNPENNAHFLKAWIYTELADGTYKIGKMGTSAGTAVRLENGTIDFTDKDGVVDTARYLAVSGKANVWDVTESKKAGDSIATGNLNVNTPVNAVLVLSNGAIRTAWIWDIDDSPVGGDVNANPNITITVGAGNAVTVTTTDMPLTNEQALNKVMEYLQKLGYIMGTPVYDGIDTYTIPVFWDLGNGMKIPANPYFFDVYHDLHQSVTYTVNGGTVQYAAPTDTIYSELASEGTKVMLNGELVAISGNTTKIVPGMNYVVYGTIKNAANQTLDGIVGTKVADVDADFLAGNYYFNGTTFESVANAKFVANSGNTFIANDGYYKVTYNTSTVAYTNNKLADAKSASNSPAAINVNANAVINDTFYTKANAKKLVITEDVVVVDSYRKLSVTDASPAVLGTVVWTGAAKGDVVTDANGDYYGKETVTVTGVITTRTITVDGSDDVLTIGGTGANLTGVDFGKGDANGAVVGNLTAKTITFDANNTYASGKITVTLAVPAGPGTVTLSW